MYCGENQGEWAEMISLCRVQMCCENECRQENRKGIAGVSVQEVMALYRGVRLE